MSTIHVVAIIKAKPGRRAEILEAFQANVPAVHAEDGCIEYTATVDADDVGPWQARFGDDTFTVVEKWESLDALKAHAMSPHMREYAAKTKDFIAAPRRPCPDRGLTGPAGGRRRGCGAGHPAALAISRRGWLLSRGRTVGGDIVRQVGTVQPRPYVRRVAIQPARNPMTIAFAKMHGPRQRLRHCRRASSRNLPGARSDRAPRRAPHRHRV